MMDLALHSCQWSRLGWMQKIQAPGRLLTRVIYLTGCMMPRRKLFHSFVNDFYAERSHLQELSFSVSFSEGAGREIEGVAGEAKGRRAVDVKLLGAKCRV
jgi:hypothetical protein